MKIIAFLLFLVCFSFCPAKENTLNLHDYLLKWRDVEISQAEAIDIFHNMQYKLNLSKFDETLDGFTLDQLLASLVLASRCPDTRVWRSFNRVTDRYQKIQENLSLKNKDIPSSIEATLEGTFQTKDDVSVSQWLKLSDYLMPVLVLNTVKPPRIKFVLELDACIAKIPLNVWWGTPQIERDLAIDREMLALNSSREKWHHMNPREKRAFIF